MEDIGSKIRQQRKLKRKSQAWLAEKLDVTKAAISRWENGACAPTHHHLQQLVGLLDLKLDQQPDDLGVVPDPFDLEARLTEAKSVKAIEKVLGEYTASLNINHFTYIMYYRGNMIKHPPVFALTNVAPEWSINYYANRWFDDDPTWHYATQSLLPINSVEIVRRCRASNQKNRLEFMKALSDHGYRYLLLVPVTTPCCNAFMAYSVNSLEKRSVLDDIQQKLFYDTHLIYSRIHRLFEEVDQRNLRHELAPKERRLIVHLVKGSKIESIAKDFGVSVSAVRQRIVRLKSKLGVETRNELVVIAMTHNLFLFDIENVDYQQSVFHMHNLNPA